MSKSNKIENLFLSVGAMKAGTTWLYEQLKEHPEIYFTPRKEIHYLANTVGIENQTGYRRRLQQSKQFIKSVCDSDLSLLPKHIEKLAWYSEFAREKDINNEWYVNLFRFNPDQKYCADFSNLYCQMEKNGWDNARKTTKNIKVIYTLRDPIKRLWSHYKFHMLFVGREEESIDAGFKNFKELLDKHFFWINTEYSKNYELLKKNLNDDELMLLYFEDFRKEPKKRLRAIEDFLGIEHMLLRDEKLNKQTNKTKEYDLPAEWLEYMKIKLEPQILEMKEKGIWHNSWS